MAVECRTDLDELIESFPPCTVMVLAPDVCFSFLITGLTCVQVGPSNGPISNVDANNGSWFDSIGVVVDIDVYDGVNVNENGVLIEVIVDDGVVINVPNVNDDDVDKTDGLS